MTQTPAPRATISSIISPEGSLEVLSQHEVNRLKSTSKSGLHDLLRRCALAVLNCGSATDDSLAILEAYKDFDIEGTIDRIGRKRKNEGKQSHPRSYKIKNGQKWAEGPQRLMGRLPNCS